MKNLVEKFNKDFKKSRMISFLSLIVGLVFFLLFIAFILVGNKEVRKKTTSSNNSALFSFCSFIHEKYNEPVDDSIEKELKELKELKEICLKAEEYKDVILAFSGDTKSDSKVDLKIILTMFASMCAFVFSIISWCDKDFEVKKAFGLSEKEMNLYLWIQDLKRDEVLLTEAQFDSWMGYFSERYTSRELEVMKLNFYII